LRFKRLDDEEPYEDGDNFDAHIGLNFISDPYELLNKMADGLSLGSDSSESEDEEVSKPTKKVDGPIVGSKRA
jgi:hypothetical protein